MTKKQLLKLFYKNVALIALIYLMATVFLYVQQRSLMYFPGGPRPEISSLVSVMPDFIKVTSEPGIDLQGLYWPPAEDKPVLVFFHGNAQDYMHWMKKLSHFRNSGYGVFFTDYRGYGGFPGKPSEEGIFQDARSFVEALAAQKNISEAQMVFYGESLGTGVAVQMATEFNPRALVLESSYSSTADIGASRYWMFPVRLLMSDHFASIDKIKALTMEKLFLHGEKDTTIPIRFGRALYDAAPEPKTFVEVVGGDHNHLYDFGAALHVLDFLSKISP